MHSRTRRYSIAILLCLITLTAARGQDALSTLLNSRHLSPVPDSLSFYRPGALVQLRYVPGAGKGDPDYRGTKPDAEAITLQQASGLIPSLEINSDTNLNIAAVLFGFNPSATFHKTKSLKADQLNFTGWMLPPGSDDNLRKKDSDTYRAAHELWKHIAFHGKTEVYLVDAVFTTTDATVSTTDGTDLSVSSGGSVNCDVPSSDQQTNDQSGQTTDSSGSPSPKKQPNLKVSDLPSSVTAAEKAAKDAAPAGCGLFHRNSKSSVSFSSKSPVPFAMIVRRVTFLKDGTMLADPVPVVW